MGRWVIPPKNQNRFRACLINLYLGPGGRDGVSHVVFVVLTSQSHSM
ncbi:hypothetical protein HMPREF9374_1033 [Desmospora sp. 8437]|nr:hypothetical protein HMPREF9374_1033 [Desmospora sp. 8437]